MLYWHWSLSVWLVATLAVIAVVTIIVGLAQAGIQVTWKPLQPKAQKISPISGAKRLFGRRGWVRFGLSLLKLVLIGGVAIYLVSGLVTDGAGHTVAVVAALRESAMQLVWVSLQLIGLLALIAILDVMYQRWQHTKDLMMTKEEVKQEMKQSDGDPL